MNNEQILKKAVRKAYKNGWTNYNMGINETVRRYTCDYDEPDLFTIIFSHEFCKAFWGECTACTAYQPNYCTCFKSPWWKHHLQQMVLEDEPLKYLEKFLK